MKNESLDVDGSVWLRSGEQTLGGAARIGLLAAIRETGSITGAAKAVGMSYKAAWDAIDAMNNLAGAPLVVRASGGKGGGGTTLTPAALRLIDTFRAIEREHRKFLEQAGAAIDGFAENWPLIGRIGMKTSARNQLAGKVTSVTREGYHQDWNTMIYNLGRNEVSAFLIASGLAWLKRYHVDGLRVDAVASMLYRDYSRKAGEWVPNMYGGRENLESIAFLKRLNHEVRQFAGAITIAEESTAWPGVTAPVEDGGLGFDFKWNMGWMHDTLHYMEEDPVYRQYHHHMYTFGMVYAYSERFVLPLSHDEVVHGKGSLIGKMPGDRWQKFANLRAYLGFMWTHPGKKLLFMGGEFGQFAEFNHDTTPHWHLLDDSFHGGLQKLVRDLNRLYGDEPALHKLDSDPRGFDWLVGDDSANSVYAFRRTDGEGRELVVVCNLTPVPRQGYRIGLPRGGRWSEVLNSDASIYGGSNMGNGGVIHADDFASHGRAHSAALTLPPLATIVLRAD